MLKEDYTDAWKSLNLHFAGILLQIPPLQLLPKLQKARNNLWTYRTCKQNHKRRSQILQVQKWQCFFSLVCVYDRPIYAPFKRRCEFSKTSIFAHKLWQKNQILKDLSICESDPTEVVNLQRHPIYACQSQQKKRIPWVLIAKQKILKTLETLNFSLWNLVKNNAEEIAELFI